MNRLFIGASGLLGRTIKKDLVFQAPEKIEFDITKPDTILNYLLKYYSSEKLDDLILSAAYTNSGASNKDFRLVHEINIDGPKNIVRCLNSYAMFTGWWPRLTYISSDYVFKGDRGMYKTTDTTYPVPNNYYAYSKAVAEEIVQIYQKHLIIRTSFCRDDVWPYEKAFYDKYTSADKVGIIAPLIAKGILNKEYGIIHVGGERKSVLEMAKSINPYVLSDSRKNFPDVGIPYDTSLELTLL